MREQILNRMLRGVSPRFSEARRQRILEAMNAFSIRQLQNMNRAGVRF